MSVDFETKKPLPIQRADSLTLRLPQFIDNMQLNIAFTEIFENKKLKTSMYVSALKILLVHSQPRNLIELAVEKVVRRSCLNNSSLHPLFEDRQLPPPLIGIALEKLISLNEKCPVDDPKKKAASDALEVFRGMHKPTDKEYYKNLLQDFSSSEIPDGDSIGTSQDLWLEIYWEKRGSERGRPLTEEEKVSDVPDKASYNLAKISIN